MEAGQAWWPLPVANDAARPATDVPRAGRAEGVARGGGLGDVAAAPGSGLLEVYARLLVEQRTAFADMNAARLTLLVTLGARLGLAPIDRTRLEPKPEPKPHRF